MEKSGLSILVDEKAVNDVLKQKTGAKAFLRSSCSLAVFIFFLYLFTFLALSEPLALQRSFEGYIRRRFDNDAVMRVNEVDSINKFWRYTDVSFIPGIYGNETAHYLYPDHVVPIFLPIDSASRLYGAGARLKQIKIVPNVECKVKENYMENFPKCFGPYAEESVNMEEFGPISSLGGKQFIYNEESEGFENSGKLGTYKPGGFILILSPNYNSSVEHLRVRERLNWLDDSTRAIFYDFTIFNFNLALYAVCRISFEISPSGAWVNTFDVEIIRQRHLNPLGTATNEELALLLGEAVLVLLVLWYLMEEASEIFGVEKRVGKNGEKLMPPYRPRVKLGYFQDTWNLLDWANLLLIILVFIFRAMTWSIAANVVVDLNWQTKSANNIQFTDYSAVAQSVRLVRSLTAFNAVLTWFKAVKYISIIPYVTTFMQTVTMSEKMLFPWIIVAGTTTFGFALSYSSAFSSLFGTPFDAFNFLIASLSGTSDFAQPYKIAPFLGSLLIMLFILGVIFVILTLFYAIMLSALSDARQSQGVKQNKKWQQNKERLQALVSTLRVSMKLDLRFRLMVPGLYSRLMNRQKHIEEREKARDEWASQKEKDKKANQLVLLGPGDPGCGRRAKHAIVSTINQELEDESDEEGSEPDLGPLRRQEQLCAGGFSIPPEMEEQFAAASGADPGSSGPGVRPQHDPWAQEVEEDLEPEAIDLVIDATRHVSDGIVERTHGARRILFAEMTQSKEVLQGIGAVLEVLGRRARDLEAQQLQLLGESY